MTAPTHPQHFKTLLALFESEIEQTPADRQTDLKHRAYGLKLEVERYEVTYNKSGQKLGTVLGEVPPYIAPTRAYMHLQTLLETHQRFSEDQNNIGEMIKQAKKARFDTLHKYGLHEVRDSLDFYNQKAALDMEAEGSAPLAVPSPNRLKAALILGAKLLVGVLTGASIDMIINPSQYPVLSAVAYGSGLGLSVLLLELVGSFAYRAKVAQLGGAKPLGFVLGAVGVVAAYMFTEAALNLEGIVGATQQAASQAANAGALLGDAVASPPPHLSLIGLTLCFVLFASLLAFFEGWDKAQKASNLRQFKTYTARLRVGGKLTKAAQDVDSPSFYQAVKAGLIAPQNKPALNWYAGTVRQLARYEETRDKQAEKISQDLGKKSDHLQAALMEFGTAISHAQKGTFETKNLKFWKVS